MVEKENEDLDAKMAAEVLGAAIIAGIRPEVVARVRHLIAIGMGFEERFEEANRRGKAPEGEAP